MLGELLVWLLFCANKVIGVMKKFDLGGGLNYFNLLVCFSAIGILYELIKHIRHQDEADRRWLYRMQRYDEQKIQDNLRIKDERDDIK